MAATRRRYLSNQLPKRKFAVVAPRRLAQIGRNEPCPCGSGKKYKDCHVKDGETFLEKVALERARAEELAQGDAAPLPWYKRLFGLR
jgi:hypothetical protein